MVVCGEQQEQERMSGRVADAMRRIDRKYFVPRKDTKDPRSHLEFMFAVPGQCETAYLVRALLLCARACLKVHVRSAQGSATHDVWCKPCCEVQHACLQHFVRCAGAVQHNILMRACQVTGICLLPPSICLNPTPGELSCHSSQG